MGFSNKGHRKVPGKTGWFRYTVYDNRTDELVILDGTAQECAKDMGLTMSSFYTAASRSGTDRWKKWTILKIFTDDLEMEEAE